MMKAGAVRALTKQLESVQYDIVHIQTPFVAHDLGMELAKRMCVPCVETYHTFFEEYFCHYIIVSLAGKRMHSKFVATLPILDRVRCK